MIYLLGIKKLLVPDSNISSIIIIIQTWSAPGLYIGSTSICLCINDFQDPNLLLVILFADNISVSIERTSDTHILHTINIELDKSNCLKSNKLTVTINKLIENNNSVQYIFVEVI